MASTSVVPAIPAAALPPLAPFPPHPYYAYPSSSPYSPFGYGLNPYGGALMSWLQAPCNKQMADPRLSSHPPADPSMMVDEFCKAYGLNHTVQAGLNELDFHVGDNLKQVLKEEYEAASFKTLSWRCVLDAYAKYKKDHGT